MTINDEINDMMEKLVETLNKDLKEPTIGASAMISLLANAALDNGHTKEMWLEDMGNAWDFYTKEREKCASADCADQTKDT